MAIPRFDKGAVEVFFKALVSDKRSDSSGQNIGFSEDYKPRIYSHSIIGTGTLTDFNLVIKIGDDWATNYTFANLRDFIRSTVNYGVGWFRYRDYDGNLYNVRMYPNSWKYHKIPGTINLWLVTIKLYLTDTSDT